MHRSVSQQSIFFRSTVIRNSINWRTPNSNDVIIVFTVGRRNILRHLVRFPSESACKFDLNKKNRSELKRYFNMRHNGVGDRL